MFSHKHGRFTFLIVSGLFIFTAFSGVKGAALTELCLSGDCINAWSEVVTMGAWATSANGIYYNSGSVGIGTTTPNNKLNVYSNAWNAGSGIPLVNITNLDVNAVDGNTLLVRGGANDSLSKTFEVQDYGGNSDFVITGLGNVGIGTTNPGANLHVAGNSFLLGNAAAYRIYEAEQLSYNGGTINADTTASNGQNWGGAVDGTTIYGPYGNIPIGNYRYVARMKVADNTYAGNVSRLQVIGGGAVSTPDIRYIKGTDFGASNTWQDFSVPFRVTAATANNLEFYAHVMNSKQIYVDYIMVIPDIDSGTSNIVGNQYISGKVGIGTVSPQSTLDIPAAASSFFVTSAAVGSLGITGQNSMVMSDAEGNLSATSSAAFLNPIINSLWGGSSGGNIWNANSGNVGIGTTNPQAILQVYNPSTVSAPNETFRSQGKYVGLNSGSLIRFTNNHSSGTNPNTGEYNLAGIAAYDYAQAWGGALALQTAADGCSGGCNLATRLLIRPDGNVGIGTANPGYKLEVGGSIYGTSISGLPRKTFSIDVMQSVKYYLIAYLPVSSGATGESIRIETTGAAIWGDKGKLIVKLGQRDGFWYTKYYEGSNPKVHVRVYRNVDGSSNVYVYTPSPSYTTGEVLYYESGWLGRGSILYDNPTASAVVPSGTLIFDSNDNITYPINESISVGAGYFNGKVGIGTTVPGAKLHVINSDITWQQTGQYARMGNILAQRELEFGQIYTTGVDSYPYIQGRWGTTYTQPMLINPYGGTVGIGYTNPGTTGALTINGNVGIGTTNPQATLDIPATGSSFFVSNAAVDSLGIPNQNSIVMSDAEGNLSATSSAAFLNPIVNSLWGGTTGGNIWNANSGNVGIGTTNPSSYKLYVANGTGSNVATTFDVGYTAASDTFGAIDIFRSGSNTVGDGISYLFSALDSGSARQEYAGIAGQIESNTAGAEKGRISFMTTDNGTTRTEKMRLTSIGNLGIGTTGPSQKLDVAGSLATGAVGVESILKLSRASNPGVSFPQGAEFAIGRYVTDPSAYSKTRLDIKLADLDGTVNTTVMSLQSNGNVGIGTTAPEDKLHILTPAGTVATLRIESTDSWGFINSRVLLESDGGRAKGIHITNAAVSNWWSGTTYDDSDLFSISRLAGVESDSVSRTSNSFLAIDNTGNVGIGTADPQATLDIPAAASSFYAYNAAIGSLGVGGGGSIVMADSSGNLSAASPDSLSLGLWGGTKNGNIWNGAAGAGKVGIGTTAPGYKLEITPNLTTTINSTSFSGNSLMARNGNGTATIGNTYMFDWAMIGASGVSSYIGQNYRNIGLFGFGEETGASAIGGLFSANDTAAGTAYGVYIKGVTSTSGNTYALYDASGAKTYFSGNVGIGTTNPQSLFTVHTGTDANFGVRAMSGGGSGTGINLLSYNDVNNGLDVMEFEASRYNFRTGNVGIGITNPADKLSVIGSARVAGNVYTNGVSAPSIASFGFNSAAYVFGPSNSIAWNVASGAYTNNNATAPDGTTTASTLTLHAVSWDLYINVAVTPGANYKMGTWVKLGTATNFCFAPNNAAAWDTIPGKCFTAADGLSTSNWTYISLPFIAPSTGSVNMHIGGHGNSSTQQTAGTVYTWNWEMTKQDGGTMISSFTGNVGIGTTNPQFTLDVPGSSGNFFAQNAIIGSLGVSGQSIVVADQDGYLSAASLASLSLDLWGGTKNGNIWNGAAGTGNVGIGTTAPLSRLSVCGAGNANSGIYGGACGTGGTAIYASGGSASNGGYDFYAANTGGRSYFAGNVGVGTTAPGVPLSVHRASDGIGLAVWQNSESNDAIQFLNAPAVSTINAINETFNIQNNGANVITLTSGNVGIGTASPDAYSIGGGRKFLTVNNSTGESFFQLISGEGNSLIDFGSPTIRRASILGLIGSDLAFQLNASNSGSALTEYVRIKGDTGNVGIGTTDPTRKLTVQGADNGSGQLRLQGTGDSASYWELGRESATTGDFRLVSNRTGTGIITALTVKDTTGYVGIGTTAPSQKLDVYSNIALQGKLAFNGGDTWLRINESSTFSNGTYFGNSIIRTDNRLEVGGGGATFGVSAGGNVNAANNVVAYGFQGNGNVGGTGAASWHPSGIYSGGSNWLYGTTYHSSGSIYGDNFAIPNSGNTYFNGGNVGIGRNDPPARLSILGTPTAGNGALINVRDSSATGANTTFGGVLFNSSPGTDYAVGKKSLNSSGYFQIRTGGGGELVTVNEIGNVGIGTTNPSAKLQVLGDVKATTFQTSAAACPLFNGGISAVFGNYTEPGQINKMSGFVNNAGVLITPDWALVWDYCTELPDGTVLFHAPTVIYAADANMGQGDFSLVSPAFRKARSNDPGNGIPLDPFNSREFCLELGYSNNIVSESYIDHGYNAGLASYDEYNLYWENITVGNSAGSVNCTK